MKIMSQKAFVDLLDEAFPGIKPTLSRYETLGFHEESTHFVKEFKGKPIAHVGVWEYPIMVDGQCIKAGALSAICTSKSHRGQGLASALIQEALDWTEERYEFAMLFTSIPDFYQKLSFQVIQEYRSYLTFRHKKGSQKLATLTFPQDNALVVRCFQEREALSNNLWTKDYGAFACFNALFLTFPTYASFYYSPSLDAILSFEIKDKSLHLFDIIAKKLPSLDQILEHLPEDIEEIYFYFCPDKIASQANPEPYLYDKTYLMVHGKWPYDKPFMISHLSRC